MTTRVIGYVRVSTDDQAREGVSLDVQETRIRAYCEAKGWQLVSVVRDEGKSAKDLKRPGLQQILAALPKRGRCFDVLVVVKLDRLTCSVRDLGNLTDAFKRARVGFTSIQESVDTASASPGSSSSTSWPRYRNGSDGPSGAHPRGHGSHESAGPTYQPPTALRGSVRRGRACPGRSSRAGDPERHPSPPRGWPLPARDLR